jgi:hypothetical protein
MESANRPGPVPRVVSGTQTPLNGRRFVLFLYVGIVSVAGALGVILGEVVDMGEPPRLFFLVPLPPNGAGFAVYGVVTVAVALGVPLVFVAYVSRRAGRDEDT